MRYRYTLLTEKIYKELYGFKYSYLKTEFKIIS